MATLIWVTGRTSLVTTALENEGIVEPCKLLKLSKW